MSRAFRRSALPAAVSMLSLALLGTSCGGGAGAGEAPPASAEVAAGDAASSPAGGWDPCTILTHEEIQAQMGWAVVTATAYPSGNQGRCVYEGAQGKSAYPPETVEAGVVACFANFPCGAGLGPFGSSADLLAFRQKLYQESSMALEPAIAAVEGLGAPAIMHELGGEYSLEVWLGPSRLVVVAVWGSEAAARALGEKALARAW